MLDDNLEITMKDDWWGPSYFGQIEPYENGFVSGLIIGCRELESDSTFDDIPFGGLKDHPDPSSTFVGQPICLNPPRGYPPVVNFARRKFYDEVN